MSLPQIVYGTMNHSKNWLETDSFILLPTKSNNWRMMCKFYNHKLFYFFMQCDECVLLHKHMPSIYESVQSNKVFRNAINMFYIVSIFETENRS